MTLFYAKREEWYFCLKVATMQWMNVSTTKRNEVNKRLKERNERTSPFLRTISTVTLKLWMKTRKPYKSVSNRVFGLLKIEEELTRVRTSHPWPLLPKGKKEYFATPTKYRWRSAAFSDSIYNTLILEFWNTFIILYCYNVIPLYSYTVLCYNIYQHAECVFF